MNPGASAIDARNEKGARLGRDSGLPPRPVPRDGLHAPELAPLEARASLDRGLPEHLVREAPGFLVELRNDVLEVRGAVRPGEGVVQDPGDLVTDDPVGDEERLLPVVRYEDDPEAVRRAEGRGDVEGSPRRGPLR